jgi:hypothetical protein
MYSYKCPNGHITEQMAKMDGSDAPTVCMAAVEPGEEELRTRQRGDALPPCGKPLTKQISATRSGFPGADNWRR